MIKVTLKDGSIKEFENALSLAEIAKSISPKLLEKATVAKANGDIKDLRDIVDGDREVLLKTKKAKKHSGIQPATLWHRLS